MKILLTIATWLTLVFLLSALLAFPVKWLWNYAAYAALFGAQKIDYWQAFCLSMLCGLLRSKLEYADK